MTQELEHKVVEIIDKLKDLSQPAMNTALDAVRAGGVMYLITGLVCGLLSVWAMRFCIQQANAVDEAPTDKEVGHMAFSIFAGISAVGFGIAMAVNLLDPDNWLAAIRPDLSLARALLHRLIP